MKRKSKRMILSILVLILSLQTSFGFIMFADVENHWSKEYVKWDSSNLKLIDGYEDGTFRPDEKLSRMSFVIALNNLLKAKNLYDDLDAIDFKYEVNYLDIELYSDEDYHLWELSNYINEKSDTAIRFLDIFKGEYFTPEKAITRYEAALLARAVTSEPIAVNTAAHKDFSVGMPYYKEINELISNGIMTGYDGYLNLDHEITRGESVVILSRIYNDMEQISFDQLELIPIKLTNEYYNQPIFQKNTGERSPEQEKRFIDAVTSLEYISFVGYIPYNERHLYDADPLKTLWSLKQEGYENVLGLNYYLIKYDKSLKIQDVLELIQEGLIVIEDLNMVQVEGIDEFLVLAKEYTASKDVLRSAEVFFRQANDIDSMLSIGLYIVQQYEAMKDYEKLLEIYQLLYQKSDNMDIKSELLNNYTYYLLKHRGAAAAIEELNTIKRTVEAEKVNAEHLRIVNLLIKLLQNQ